MASINSMKIGAPTTVSGFIVPLEFINGMNLSELEQTLGINSGQFSEGIVIYRLLRVPMMEELEYFGDTRSPEHRFEENRNKEISREALSGAAYNYIKANRNIVFVKIVPLKNYDFNKSNDENWPSGKGAMQFKIKKGTNIPATFAAEVKGYPYARFYI